ncbi:MAG: cyclic nucleotide-binding domain-containing protein [Proteobacteria bacterium]|nr:cyclic nucleotide-binding domain-containing protein [Pseudomonadota bacterium]
MSPFPEPSKQPDKEVKSQLVQQLVAEIEVAAKAGNFKLADQLHEKLIATDSMAISEIIKSSGIIEDEKTAGIDRDHLAMWGKFYDSLSDEERNCLYYSMKRYVLRPKTKILTYGTMNNRLFLIEKGHVTIFFPKDGKNVILAKLGPGDILGEYTFSTISLCSASAITHTEVQLMCLESSAADGWEDKYPGLYEKLVDFCLKGGSVDEILRNKKMEKRRYERQAASGAVKATLLTNEGGKTENVYSGGLSDISLSGCCFSMRLSQKATARALLAKYLLLFITAAQEEDPASMSVVARVVRVSFHLYGDFSVHVQFSKLLSEDTMRKFVTRPEGSLCLE